MKAVLLVGGEGTRLRPLTYDVPKPLLPIFEIPYLELLVSYLKRFGVEELILAAGYLSEQIEAFCKHEKELNIKLRYVIERTPLGTGGAVGNVRNFLDDTFLVFNGDILTDFNLEALIDFHRKKKASISLALVSVSDPTRYGVADLQEDGLIRCFVEKPELHEAPSHYINAGIYVIEPSVVTSIPSETKSSIERELFPMIAASKGLYGLVRDDYWLDMGTPVDYRRAHEDVLSGKISLQTKSVAQGKNWIGKGVKIDPSAQILSPVMLGDHVVVGAKAKVGPFSVIGRETIVSSGAEVDHSVLWESVVVGENTRVSHSIIGRNAKIMTEMKVIDEVIRST